MPLPKRQLLHTVCPCCGSVMGIKRSGALDSTRFDVTKPIYVKDFIRVVESQGRAKGFAIVERVTLRAAAADPAYKEYVDQLHANVTMLKEYLDRINP